MADQHRTVDMDQLAIIRAMLVDQASKSDARLGAIDAKVSQAIAEGNQRGAEQAAQLGRLEREVAGVRHETKNLAKRLTVAEEDIRSLRDRDADIMRETSETDLAQEAAIGGAIAHVAQLDQGLSDVKAGVTDLTAVVADVRTVLESQNRINQAVCGVMGIDYERAAEEPRPHATPTEKAAQIEEAKPKTDLVQMARENKVTAFVAVLVFLTEALQFAMKLLGNH